MKKMLYSFLVLLFVTSVLQSDFIEGSEQNEKLLFGYSNQSDFDAMKKTLKQKNISFSEVSEIYAIEISSEHIDELSHYEWKTDNKKVKLPIIKRLGYHDTNYSKKKRISLSDSSVYEPYQWAVNEVTSNGRSYERENGNHTVKIGVVDSGIDFTHPALQNNIVSKGRSYVKNDTNTQDVMGHCTMVSGMIAANGKIKGSAPNIGIIPYKVFGQEGAESKDIIKAIIDAANDGVDVINLSLGTYKATSDKDTIKAYDKAIKYAEKKGTLVVASSGTDGYDMDNARTIGIQLGYAEPYVHLPGGTINNVLTVGATNKIHEKTIYSNFGTGVDIAAPVGDYGPEFETKGIYDPESMTVTTFPMIFPQTELSKYLGFDQGYELMIGTSLASPVVSGGAGVIIAEYKEQHGKKPNVNKIKQILIKSSEYQSQMKQSKNGQGIININNALNLIKEKR